MVVIYTVVAIILLGIVALIIALEKWRQNDEDGR